MPVLQGQMLLLCRPAATSFRGKLESSLTNVGLHSVPQTPVSVGFKIGYESQGDSGAILVTNGDVTHNQITPRASTRAKDWFINNAEAILQEYDVTKQKGIWVITKTYTAKRRAFALLHSKEASVVFEVNVELQAAGKTAPSAGWWSRLQEGVWKDHTNVSANLFDVKIRSISLSHIVHDLLTNATYSPTAW
jgi:hypothetical protein